MARLLLHRGGPPIAASTFISAQVPFSERRASLAELQNVGKLERLKGIGRKARSGSYSRTVFDGGFFYAQV